jgi:hypothetical protein
MLQKNTETAHGQAENPQTLQSDFSKTPAKQPELRAQRLIPWTINLRR